jgi:multiple sugar transport system substrate-binding protein
MLQSDTTVRTLGLIHQWPFMLAFNEGLPPYSLDGKVNYNTPGMKAYLEWMRMLVNEGLTLPGLRYGQFRPYAVQNKLLFGNDWTCFDGIVRSLDESKTLTPGLMYETWGAAALPAGKDGVYRVPVQAHSLVVFENSKNKEAAAKFLEFVVSNQVSVEEYIGRNGFTPVTKSAFSKVPELEKSEFISSFVRDVVPASITMPTGADYALYAEVIMTGVQDAITSNRSVDDILKEGQQKLEDIFK